MANDNKKVIELICAPKYLQVGEDHSAGMKRIAYTLADDEEHYQRMKEILRSRRFLPAGRIQASVGSARKTTAFNCFVSRTIDDSMEGIMAALSDAAETMRLGGGDGFDFSTLRPKGARIKSLDSTSSGPISFMHIWDAMCNTIKSAGHRRGAMMGTMRIDHPDIEEFITCKRVPGALTNFNISVLVTDEFMKALDNDEDFDLKFDGQVYKTVRARYLWDLIMRNTWDHAEPGVIFIDTVNKKNNLWYAETIAATNPCGEQPLPPNGACLLGSFNLTQYVEFDPGDFPFFNYNLLRHDIPYIVRAMDNVIDNTIYPLKSQEIEAKNKRRMGLGITGYANALEFLGYSYGSEEALAFLEEVLGTIRDTAYTTSVSLAIEKGPFPLFDKEKYVQGQFVKTLPKHIQELIATYGIRNSHLLSIAPTGTISLFAGNVSSGIEPVFSVRGTRKVYVPATGLQEEFYVEDYGYGEWGIYPEKTAANVTADEHVDTLITASRLVDSACSKTCNVGDNVTFEEFKDIYLKAYKGGASGCTTFRPAGLREGVLKSADNDGDDPVAEGAACYIDPETGNRTCDE